MSKNDWTAKRIKALRKKLDMTQLEFSSMLGVTPVTCARWETCAAKPSKLACSMLDMKEIEHSIAKQEE
jgi:DNA-binding transcriptional regulator YiaG